MGVHAAHQASNRAKGNPGAGCSLLSIQIPSRSAPPSCVPGYRSDPDLNPDVPVPLVVDRPLGTLDHVEGVDEPGLFREIVRGLMLHVTCTESHE